LEDFAPVGAAPTQVDRGAARAAWSVVAGIISIVGLFPFIQLPAAIAGLVLGIRALESTKRTLAIIGIVTSLIGLALSLWAFYALWMVVNQIGMDAVLQKASEVLRGP
jgi:hypothetical protein